MGNLSLLAEARAAGLDVRADGERLVVRGPRSAEVLARSLLASKPEVLAELAREEEAVAWRVAVFLSQIPARGPIGVLAARPELCASCGEPREATQTYICHYCQRAKEIAVNQVREAVPAFGAAPTPENEKADAAPEYHR